MLPRNVIGWLGLLVAARLKLNRNASADWLPADAVGGSIFVVIGPFIAVHWVTVAVLSAAPLIQLTFTPVRPSIHPTVSFHLTLRPIKPLLVLIYHLTLNCTASIHPSIRLTFTCVHPATRQTLNGIIHPIFLALHSFHPSNYQLYLNKYTFTCSHPLTAIHPTCLQLCSSIHPSIQLSPAVSSSKFHLYPSIHSTFITHTSVTIDSSAMFYSSIPNDNKLTSSTEIIFPRWQVIK